MLVHKILEVFKSLFYIFLVVADSSERANALRLKGGGKPSGELHSADGLPEMARLLLSSNSLNIGVGVFLFHFSFSIPVRIDPNWFINKTLTFCLSRFGSIRLRTTYRASLTRDCGRDFRALARLRRAALWCWESL